MNMKRIMLLSAVSAFVLCGAAACGQKPAPPSKGSRTGFALSFFKNADSVYGPKRNMIVSPYSAGVVMSMLLEGAEGETRAEFDNALNGCLFMAEEFGTGDTVVIKSANSVWIDNDFSVRNRYVSLMQKDYKALVTTLDFADPATLRAINDWSAENTDGKIREIFSSLSPQMVMVLADALYFKAPWFSPFNPSLTQKAVFHGVSSDSEVSMMYRKGHFPYGEYQGCQMIGLPYEGGRYSMYVVLPPKGVTVESMLPYIDENVYDMAMKSMTPAEVKLRLPKMKLESSAMLNDVLKKMGVVTAFSSAADFKGISAMGPLRLDQVSQKCYMEVTESGTEAAAVTTAAISLTSVRPDHAVKVMTVDRPFMFFINDDETGNILFAGKVVNL